jgi:hypothetical protein
MESRDIEVLYGWNGSGTPPFGEYYPATRQEMIMLCPVCYISGHEEFRGGGDHQVHADAPPAWDSETASANQGHLTMMCSCELGHKFLFEIRFHKGEAIAQTSSFAHLSESDQDDSF